ncbi:hypothetical protein pb186bvf_020983 [Paramecium bursaria]
MLNQSIYLQKKLVLHAHLNIIIYAPNRRYLIEFKHNKTRIRDTKKYKILKFITTQDHYQIFNISQDSQQIIFLSQHGQFIEMKNFTIIKRIQQLFELVPFFTVFFQRLIAVFLPDEQVQVYDLKNDTMLKTQLEVKISFINSSEINQKIILVNSEFFLILNDDFSTYFQVAKKLDDQMFKKQKYFDKNSQFLVLSNKLAIYQIDYKNKTVFTLNIIQIYHLENRFTDLITEQFIVIQLYGSQKIQIYKYDQHQVILILDLFVQNLTLSQFQQQTPNKQQLNNLVLYSLKTKGKYKQELFHMKMLL